jgi:hypothetical protein
MLMEFDVVVWVLGSVIAYLFDAPVGCFGDAFLMPQ